MKKIIFVMLFISSVSFAGSGKDYCANSARKVLYTKLDLDSVRGYMSSSSIGTAELIVNLPDGTAVIVPCFGNRVEASEGMATKSLIVKQENVFAPVKGKVANGSRVVGVNYTQATQLLETSTAFILKNYIIVKSKVLQKLNEEKLKRSIDKR